MINKIFIQELRH